MQESMHANLLAAATLPSSAASTPTAVSAEHIVNPLAPCEGPLYYRPSARPQRNTTQPVSAGLLAAPSRLASQSAVPREEQFAAGASHAVQSTVQPRLAGAWLGQTGEEPGVSAAAAAASSSISELGDGNGSWDAPASHNSSSSDPWSQPQHMSGSQSSTQHALVAEPNPQQQAYRWHQHSQLEPPTWQQQQQGWYYNGNGSRISIRGASHSPRGRRRQHQQRMQVRSNSMGASHHPQQQWQQQQTAPSQQYEGQLPQGQQAPAASQLPGHQQPVYLQLHQQQQQQQQAVVTAADPWQAQQQMLPPPPPPAWWHHQQPQQQTDPWHQQLPQQQWGAGGNSNSSSSGGNWPAPPGANGTTTTYGAWGVYNSNQQGAAAGSSAAAAVPLPRHDPNPTNRQLDPFSLMYHHSGHESNPSTYQGLGSTSSAGSAPAGVAAAAGSSSWPAAGTQEQQPQQHQQQRRQQQQQLTDVRSHMLSQLETDSSEEPEEWFSVTHSPVPLELQQQQQGAMLLPNGSSRWPQTSSQGGMLQASTVAPAVEVAAPVQPRPAAATQQLLMDDSHVVVQDQRHAADSRGGGVSNVENHPRVAGEGGRSSSSSSSRFDDVTSDGDSDLPELISSPGYTVDHAYEAAAPSGASLVPPPPPAAAAGAGATDGSGVWGMSAQQQQQQQQGPARQVADAWVAPQLFEQDPVQNSWPPPPQQQQQRRLGSIDELQPTPYGPRSMDGSISLLQAAAAAATGLEQAAAAQQDQQLWLQEQQLLEQQLQQLEAEAAIRSSSPASLAAWRADELYRLAADATGYMALGAAEDDGDSTAATAADSSSIDGYPPAAAAAVVPLELPQLARVRTAAAPPARSGAALEDSPNAQMGQLMRRLQQQYDMLQQQQYTAAQLELEQQQILNRYGLAAGARGFPQGVGFGMSTGSSNATAAGAPYRPLVAAAAAGPGSSAAAAAVRPAADRDNALLQQLLDSASRSTQEVDATAMAALAGSFEQQRQWREQQWRQQQQAGADLAAQWEFRARRRRGLRHMGGHGEMSHVMQQPAIVQSVPHQTPESQRASVDSLSWQDSIPPLLDADPELDAFEGLTPTLSPHRPQNRSNRPFTAHNPSYNTALYANHVVQVSNPAQPAQMLAGSAAAAAGLSGWAGPQVTSQAAPQGQGLTANLFSPGGGYLLSAPVAAAAAAAGGGGGQVGVGTLQQQQQQQQQQLRLQVPPPGQLVRGRWSSSSSSSSGLSPALTAATSSGQHDVLQTPQAAILVPQQAPNAPRRRQQRQPLMALQQQQQQWAQAAAWPDHMQAVYGPYSASSSAAATAGSAAAAGGVASAGPLPPLMFAPGPGVSSSSSSWQQLHGVAASVPSSGSSGSSRSGGVSMGRQSSMQLMMQNYMMNWNRHAQASAAAAAPAAMAADQGIPAAAAAAPMQGIWPLDSPSNRAFQQQQQQQHQWQRDLLLAMQLDQPHISVNPLASTPATAAAAAAAAAARQRQSDLQRFIQQARASMSPREGGPLTLTPIPLQQVAHGQGLVGPSGNYTIVDEASGLVAGAGPVNFRPDLMVRMMRLMNLDEAVMLPRIIGGGDGLSYEQLIGLEDVRVVVPTHVLGQLPRRTVPKEDKAAATDAESVICTICQCELAGQELVVQLPCKHDYHEGCICEWLSKYKKTCPVCKAEVRLDT